MCEDTGATCSPECERLIEQINEAHRRGKTERRTVKADAELWGHSAHNPWKADPAILYGLLTETDVAELERRRARFLAAGRIFPTTQPQAAIAAVA